MEFKTFSLNEVKNNDIVVGDFILKSAEIKPTKNGKLFIEGELFNNNLSINFKVWEATKDLFEKMKFLEFVRIKGVINEYQNVKQLIVNSYKEIPKEYINIQYFIPSTKLDINKAKEYINNIVDNIQNEDYANIINNLLSEDFYIKGASKSNYYNKNGGLLEHTIQMLKQAEVFLDNDITGLYENINKDLLYTGILLHDIGKIDELKSNKYGIIEEYSMQGELLGHIVIGIQKIVKSCCELNIDITNKDIILLNHLLVSHHGKLEYGSPKLPVIPEAELLFELDYNSTYMQIFNETINNLQEDEFSNRQFLLNNRKLYKA